MYFNVAGLWTEGLGLDHAYTYVSKQRLHWNRWQAGEGYFKASIQDMTWHTGAEAEIGYEIPRMLKVRIDIVVGSKGGRRVVGS